MAVEHMSVAGSTAVWRVLPFAGLLLSVAILPTALPRFWHRGMFWIMAGWMLALLGPMMLSGEAAAALAWHAVLLDYLPFVTLLLALYAAGGGVLLEGGPWGTPTGNTMLLAIGTLLAGVMGTTGVAMVLIHPLLRANAHRRRRVHLVLFFIILCGNAGGATSPLGDPPLYIGFLLGVPFLWPLTRLGGPLLLLALPLLAAFWVTDRRMAAGDPAPPRQRLRLRGAANLGLVGIVVADVLLQGVWHPGAVVLFGQAVAVERLVGVGVCLAVCGLSVAVTPRSVRAGNLFSWAPMLEVGVLFLGIFVTIAPVLALLSADVGPWLAHIAARLGVPEALLYFWLTGFLSAFLDNAPTYLAFFRAAGLEPAALDGPAGAMLQAIAAGAVFFGALTYVGNAPNMMLRGIAAHRGIRMPGFFGYMGLSSLLLLPLFGLLSLVLFL